MWQQDQHSFDVSVSLIIHYATLALYGSIGLALVLSPTNPIFKISIACYAGLYSIVSLIYAPIVYFKTLTGQTNDSNKQGLIKRILNFLPMVVEKLSFLLKDLIYFILKFFKIVPQSGIQLNALLVAYFIVTLRKLIALLCWCYVSEEDDNSLRLKAFLGFCFLNLVQHRFIIKNDTSRQTSSSQTSFKDGLKSFFQKSGKNINVEIDKLKFRRNFIFSVNLVLTILLFISMFKLYWEFKEGYTVVISILTKSLLVVDLEFLRTMTFEMGGLELNFKTYNDEFGSHKV
ncbi:hypothetical protein CANARDRAFT_7315 [[Candida] arabinofermentans NRRL YB-2248]|uniref:Uncharacterized protein n=1 Tax=[Candida] arabinofermentans NRRL YB-2248 TaxID=983967 RepID=A0A1E4T2P0_9ASCO|nr:hypothetical protein CANARDRAFT_7315 [[Candida] arabinofermentans NRRL YB-2248]